MVTYLYWIVVIGLVCVALFGLGMRLGKWKPALVLAAVIAVVGSMAYYFWLQQIFVKRYGGVMSITIPQGLQHIGSTWKDDNLWIEDYNPQTNECIFREYSRGDMLQGRVVLKNCHPIGARPSVPPATATE
ncbi:hypothetical protein [Marinobacter zhejiangensis]|uniref:Uncharacterized protein n=1 Tax=Marinobacter zhejiangensis TaxID=488535 RepID=A0A1I4T2V4_9GAMM|nr:hypothetical protein [Marinobacter zhejiangensis]SFM71052.1 hypothetical protein SAMN04487963_3463 [Marinobacter zhejiangensis]